MMMRGHKGSIYCLLKLSNGRVISGSWDKTLRIWNSKTGQCEHVLRGHQGNI